MVSTARLVPFILKEQVGENISKLGGFDKWNITPIWSQNCRWIVHENVDYLDSHF